MKKRSSPEPDLDEMPAEVDFSSGIRGKYAKGGGLVRITRVELDSDVAEAFPTKKAVNTALRRVMRAKSKPREPRKRT
jgi:hypothetical protein